MSAEPSPDGVAGAGRDDLRLPAPGDVVRLTWGGEALAARAVRPVDEVTVLCRRTDASGNPPGEGAAVELHWPDGLGLLTASAVLARVRGSMLAVTATGPAERSQRRAHYRASVAVDVELVHGRRTHRARTRDLSEGGARLALEDAGTSTAAGPLPVTDVTARVTLDDRQLTLPATVLRHDPAPGGGELGLVFGPVDATVAAAIRREVVTAQLDARRKDTR